MAIALLSQRDVERYGAQLSRCYCIEDAQDFATLLARIDDAEAAMEARQEKGTA